MNKDLLPFAPGRAAGEGDLGGPNKAFISPSRPCTRVSVWVCRLSLSWWAPVEPREACSWSESGARREQHGQALLQRHLSPRPAEYCTPYAPAKARALAGFLQSKGEAEVHS